MADSLFSFFFFYSTVDLGSESAVLMITRLIMLQFISPGFQQVGKPWSWSTNDRALAERVTDCLVNLDVEDSLIRLLVGQTWENALSDSEWARFLANAPGLRPSPRQVPRRPGAMSRASPRR